MAVEAELATLKIKVACCRSVLAVITDGKVFKNKSWPKALPCEMPTFIFRQGGN